MSESRRRFSVLTLLAVFLLVIVLGLPAFQIGAALLAILASLLAGVPERRPFRWLFLSSLVALAVIIGGSHQSQFHNAEEYVQARYSQAIENLNAQGNEIADSLNVEWPADPSQSSDTEPGELEAVTLHRLALFRLAEKALTNSDGPGDSVFIVDTDGVAEAWAGTGFRHSLPETDLPDAGLFALSSFTATTLALVRPLEGARYGERVVVGTSFSSTLLPDVFAPPAWLRPFVSLQLPKGTGRLWSLSEGSPARLPLTLREGIGISANSQTIAWIVLLLLGVLGLDRLAGSWPLAGRGGEGDRPSGEGATAYPKNPTPGATFQFALLFLVFTLAAVFGDVVSIGVGVTHVFLGALAALATLLRGLVREGLARAIAAFGFFLAMLVSLSSLATGRLPGSSPIDLRSVGGRFDIPVDLVILSLVSWGAGVVILWAMAGASRRAGHFSFALPFCFIPLLTVAHLQGSPLGGGLLVCLAAAVLAMGKSPRSTRGWVGLAVAAALTTSSVWSVVIVSLDRRDAERILSPTESTFSGEGRDAVMARVEHYLEHVDLSLATLGLLPEGSRERDLALLLWLGSPLSEASGPTGIRVIIDDRSEFFGLGLEVDANEEVTLKASGATGEADTWARESLIHGRVKLGGKLPTLDQPTGQRPLEVEFFAIPMPSLGLNRNGARGLARRFLLGETSTGAVWPAGFAVAAGPWSGEPAVVLGREVQVRRGQVALRPNRPDPVETTSKSTITERWFEESFSLVRLYYPISPWLSRISRSAVQASRNLVLGAVLLAFVSLVVLLGRGATTQLLGPFSRRLIMAFALLASVPIVLLSTLLLQSFSARLQAEQRADGEAALSSAERMIGDYLSSLDPGFSVTGALDDELLSWISSIVHHEVNLYWRGSVLTSSRPELFSAGLLPSQIPGDVFAALDLEGRQVAARFNRSGGDSRYLELYRGVQLPGDPGGFGLFVSVPMLAQEFETTLTLRTVLNQALVLATFLTLLLVVIATRFAEVLTTPITAIVAGTQRIGSGDTSLGLNPRIPELRRLARAIDEMASKIASGRERLFREKRVVDMVIANIKSAVVSFGENETVILRNRVAADLLHVQPGDSLEDLAARLESEELAQIVRRRPNLAERTSVKLHASEDPQEWTVQWLPISGGGDPAALLVMEDVTEVLRSQRLAAWAEMARIIAHEIKNPLTPIRLSADHLRQVYENAPERLEEVFDRCIDNILVQVEELRMIAGEFSTYSRIPTANKSLSDLAATVKDVLESYRTGASAELAFTHEIEGGEILVEHDPRLIGRVLRNLYENAIRACSGKGRIHMTLRTNQTERTQGAENSPRKTVIIEVFDSGPGVKPDDLPRIFEPSFSASTGGTGLGLPISRSIITDHGGEITAANLKARGDAPAQLASDSEGDPTQLPLNGLKVSIHLPI